jgi:phosphoglycerate dehydrogenase-like enzyme
VGVVGFGRIGREVVHRVRAFRGRVLVFDPLVSAAEIDREGATPVASLDALLPECDLLTLHCPSTARTRRMIDAAALAKMKRGALLVNVARGDVVDTPALVAALESGQLAGAALDVCDPEPIPPGHLLLRLSNVIVTPHVASASCRAVRRLREEATGTVVRALRGEPLPNVMNGVPNLR